MAIDVNKFRNALSSGFIELLESKRGVASALAKAIDKPSSFINEVKRGKPVNSIHLKAVGIVFGPEKVLELLALEDGSEGKNVHSDFCKIIEGDNSKVTKVVFEHQNLIKRFKNPERGLRWNERLIDIEDAGEELCDKVDNYLQGAHDAAMAIKKSKKKIPQKTSSAKKRRANEK